jgi:hypothetical protein
MLTQFVHHFLLSTNFRLVPLLLPSGIRLAVVVSIQAAELFTSFFLPYCLYTLRFSLRGYQAVVLVRHKGGVCYHVDGVTFRLYHRHYVTDGYGAESPAR